MPENQHERIAKAKALAKLFGAPEQEVIQLALEQSSGDPKTMQAAEGKLAALGGAPEGSLYTLDDSYKLPSQIGGKPLLKDLPRS